MFLPVGDLILALPFALIAFYALVGALRGVPLRLAWLVQALLTVQAFAVDSGSSSSVSAIVFLVPLICGPAIATILMIASTFFRATQAWRQSELRQ